MILLGRVLKPHGLKGEVRVLPINSSLESLESGTVLFLKRKNREIHLTLEHAREGPKYLILRFREISSLEQAESLRGFEIYGEGEKSPSLEGKKLFAGGRLIGVVREIMEIPFNTVLVLETPSGKELLVPLSLCKERGDHLEAELPEGLEEI